MKVAGIVVCNPDYNRLIENINALYPQVDRIAVYLNSEINRSRLNGLDKLQYLSDGNNRGIATALNAIMSYADKLGADWCLLLDQDSVVSKKCVEGYEKYKNLDNAAILTPKHIQRLICVLRQDHTIILSFGRRKKDSGMNSLLIMSIGNTVPGLDPEDTRFIGSMK